MRKHLISRLVGLLGIATGGCALVFCLLIPMWNALAESPASIGFLLCFAAPFSIPACIAFLNGFQMVQEPNKENLKRTVGCLCILLCSLGPSGLFAEASDHFQKQWMSWIFFITAILGIMLYATICQKLLEYEGFETNISEFFGTGQLSVLAFLLWMSLSSSFELSGDGPLILELARGFGPFIAAIGFFKLGNRSLRRIQKQAFAAQAISESTSASA